MIDYPDVGGENHANYHYVEDFGDKASSVRYCIPPGWRYRLYQHDSYGGNYRDLQGKGSLNLHTAGFGDTVSSSRWLHY